MKKFLIAGTILFVGLFILTGCGTSNSKGFFFGTRESDHSRGSADAPVTVIEYSDFQCPACRSFYTTMTTLEEEYPEKIRFIYRHYPLPYHPDAERAAEFAEAAGAQGKFWEAYQALFEFKQTRVDRQAGKISDLSQENILKMAGDLQLDVDKIKIALDNHDYADVIKADMESIDENGGLIYTPYLIINGYAYAKTQNDLQKKTLDYTALRDLIEKL